MSRGILQPDMWGVKPASDRWDWVRLRADIAQHGVRNSLLVAPMPTASTSQVGACRTHVCSHQQSTIPREQAGALIRLSTGLHHFVHLVLPYPTCLGHEMLCGMLHGMWLVWDDTTQQGSLLAATS